MKASRPVPSLALLALCALTACGSTPRLPPAALAPAVERTDATDDRAMHLALIVRMQHEGAWYASLAHIDAHRARHGNSAALQVLRADALRETGRLDDADAAYRGLTQGREAAAAWHGLGLVTARRGDPATASTHLERAVRLDPLNAVYVSDLGFARMQAGQHAAAREPLAQAAELAPADPRAIANLATWLMVGGDVAGAARLMDEAGLPPGTRDEVHRLSQALRSAPQARMPPAASGGSQQTASGAFSPPRTMLQRFGGADDLQEVSR